MKEKLKKVLQFIANPRLLVCFLIAWFITNGWSYIMLLLGAMLRIQWMVAVSGAYLAFLWLPLTPEKIITFALAIILMKWLYPEDKKTLAVLKHFYEKTKNTFKKKKCAE